MTRRNEQTITVGDRVRASETCGDHVGIVERSMFKKGVAGWYVRWHRGYATWQADSSLTLENSNNVR